MLTNYLQIAPPVLEALENEQPVVALESTIIAHGMPFPQNKETALRVEQLVREEGAVPATIAILGGQLRVGLSEEEIDYIAQKGKKVHKASRRDIPFLVAQKEDAATTVAATMLIAKMAGLTVFATGGIGGVHRETESKSMDISADLQELAKTNVVVVCAGVKSILDIGLTLEYLETHGVPVVGYQTNEFPSFYTRESGFNVDYRIDSTAELAKAIRMKWEMGLEGSVIVANPIPSEFEMPIGAIDQAIALALNEAKQQNISGKKITPFLLSHIKELTKGESLRSNIQLVYNNAKVAAQLAKSMANL